jgi:hypothetical protein
VYFCFIQLILDSHSTWSALSHSLARTPTNLRITFTAAKTLYLLRNKTSSCSFG